MWPTTRVMSHIVHVSLAQACRNGSLFHPCFQFWSHCKLENSPKDSKNLKGVAQLSTNNSMVAAVECQTGRESSCSEKKTNDVLMEHEG